MSLNGVALSRWALIDSGASFSALPRSIGDQFGEDWDRLPRLFYLGGVARGVDERGALQLETTAGVQSMYGGEISLRAAP